MIYLFHIVIIIFANRIDIGSKRWGGDSIEKAEYAGKTALTMGDEIRLLNKPKSMPFFHENWKLFTHAPTQLPQLPIMPDILNSISSRATKARGSPQNPFSFHAVVTDESAAGADIPRFFFNKRFCYHLSSQLFRENDEHSNLCLRIAGYVYRNGRSSRCYGYHPSWR